MSKRTTVHAATDKRDRAACGVHIGLPSRQTHAHKKVTCNRCRKILGLGDSWAQSRTTGPRKPPKRAVGKRPELAAPYGGDYPGVQLIDSHTLRALKDCDTDPRKFPMLRIDIKGYPTREVPNPIYVPPTAAQVYGSFKPPAPSARAKIRALNRGLDALLGGAGQMVWVPAERLQALELVYKLGVELCDAIDAAEEDIGGHRSTREIIGELGPATSKVESLSNRVRDENEG